MSERDGPRGRKMTIRQLVDALSEFDPDLPVVVDGYESGYHDADRPQVVELARNVSSEGYCGPHDKDLLESPPTAPHVHIGRYDPD